MFLFNQETSLKHPFIRFFAKSLNKLPPSMRTTQ